VKEKWSVPIEEWGVPIEEWGVPIASLRKYGPRYPGQVLRIDSARIPSMKELNVAFFCFSIIAQRRE
jgi:hypothetical protein